MSDAPVRVEDGRGARLAGSQALVYGRAAELERRAATAGLVTRRELRELDNGRMEMTLVFQRPVPRRWWHDWRAVAAVALAAALGLLGCAYAAYRAVVALVAGAVTATAAVAPVLGGVAVLLGGIWLAVKLCGSGGSKTFSGTFKGKIS